MADVDQSAIAATVFEACPTRIYLPNDRAREPRTRAFYESLGLNQRQIAIISEAAAKRDYYIQTRAGARLADLALGPAALAFLGASTPRHQTAIDNLIAEGGAGATASAMKTFPTRVGGLVSILQESLNVDGYEVLAYDRQEMQVRLDKGKLAQQFEVDL